MHVPFIVGAYAALPESKTEQDQFYDQLRVTDWVDGIEIPFPGVLETEEGLKGLASQLSPRWKNTTLTLIPGTMQQVWADGNVGLASPDDEGRGKALDFVRHAGEQIKQLNDAFGQQAIARVLVHSAPTGKAAKDAFARSLDELSPELFDGADIMVEHCDAHAEDHKPEKGFLPLTDEVELVRERGLGIHLNWGRSVLETRNPATVEDHIMVAGEAGVLRGLMFSGAGPAATDYGYAWIDGHLPMATDEPTSLMTADRITHAARLAHKFSVHYLGAKVCVPKDATVYERMAMIENVRHAAEKHRGLF